MGGSRVRTMQLFYFFPLNDFLGVNFTDFYFFIVIYGGIPLPLHKKYVNLKHNYVNVRLVNYVEMQLYTKSKLHVQHNYLHVDII